MAAPQLRPDAEALALIETAARRLRAAVGAALPDGLAQAEFQVLQRLAEGSGSPAELARALRLSKGALTPIVARLERRGLAVVLADPADARRKRLSLTAAGAQAHAAALRSLRPGLERLRAEIPEAEFRAAVPFLRRLEAALAGLSPRA